jgi:hyperosmotically inducible protein
MKNLQNPLRVLALAAAVAVAMPLYAQQTSNAAQTPVTGSDADNTRINSRDKSDTLKPTDQSNAKADIKLAAEARRAIVKDKSLSSTAHNVKLIANGGVVTLRGPVASATEKQKVEQIVSGVQGVTRVDNNLDVEVAKNKE